MPVPTRAYEPTDEVAGISLELGRLLMQAGASARDAEEVATQVGRGLGAQRLDLRLGYASLAITISIASQVVTRRQKVGPIDVNQRLYHALCTLAGQIQGGSYSCATAQMELESVLRDSPYHRDWVVAIAVGLACAAFGRLLAVNWIGVAPIFAASFLAQLLRGWLAARHVNAFLSAGVVAFIGSTLAGFGSRLMGSNTVALDMIVTVLLLVPGVPAFISQVDILEGRPTLGSARAIWVAVILVFMTAGVRLAQGVLGVGR